MKNMRTIFFIASLTVALFTQVKLDAQRDPLKRPFSSTSIWNMPIGSEAVYLPAQIEEATSYGMTVDEDILIFEPNAPLEDVYINSAGWDVNKDRCEKQGDILFTAPIPTDFIVSPDTWDGLTPNSGAAILLSDGVTIRQTQPFSKCNTDFATSQYVFEDVNIYGMGRSGAHGGSGLSAIGGTLRLGELDDPTDTIRHVLKVNLFAAKNLFYNSEFEGYRWPAYRADAYANGVYGTQRSSAVVEEMRMGALLALAPEIEIDAMNLETTPAKILARAFQDYGAYVVDDTAWNVYAIVTEWSTEGRVIDEFEAAWGFPFNESSRDTPWTRDMKRIFSALSIVINNSPTTIGGGGTPRQPLAPAFEVTNTTHSVINSSIRVQPNPAQQIVQVNSEIVMNKFTIFSISGSVLKQETVHAREIQINVNGYDKGIYFLVVEDANGGVYYEKVLVVE